MLNKIETIYFSFIKENNSFILSMSFLMIILSADYTNTGANFFALLLMVSFLPEWIYNKKISLLNSFPISKNEIFWISFSFIVLISLFSITMGSSIFIHSNYGIYINYLINISIFILAYWGITVLLAIYGFNPYTSILIMIVDSVLGGIGGKSNIYSLISPVYQNNTLFSLLFSLSIVGFSWLNYIKKTGKV